MVKQRWNPMGVISPGSPGMYEEQFSKALGKLGDYCISNVPWYNPNAPLTKVVEKAFLKQNPKDRLVFHGLNAGFTFEAILIARMRSSARRAPIRRRLRTRSGRRTSRAR
jgi:branched-chain amino acid transport system substrate-binding protein